MRSLAVRTFSVFPSLVRGLIARRRSIFVDIAFYSGLGLIAVGSYRIYGPAGLIVGGILLVCAAVLYSRGTGA